MNLVGKVVLITGASSGIGRALAVEFARQGARVGLLARRHELLTEVCAAIRSAGGTAEFEVSDASDRASVSAGIKALTSRLGPCDIMIANAGVGATNSAEDLVLQEAERVIRTNLLGPLYAFDAVLPEMIARDSGHLVGISSVAAFKGLPTAAAYCASKAGLNGFLESIRISLCTRNVNVTTICPGYVRTEMTAKNSNMFWVLDAEPAARKIVNAIRRRKKVYSFPKRMRWLIGLTRWLPDRFIYRMIGDGK